MTALLEFLKPPVMGSGSRLAAVVALAFGLALASWLTWSGGILLQWMLAGLAWLIVPALAVPLLFVLGRPRRDAVEARIARRTTRVLGFVFLLSVTQIAGCVGGELLLSKRVDDAQRWCERVVRELEAHRSEHGSYPESIDGFPSGEVPPRMCRSSLVFRRHADRVTLEFATGRGFETWLLDSRAGWSPSGG